MAALGAGELQFFFRQMHIFTAAAVGAYNLGRGQRFGAQNDSSELLPAVTGDQVTTVEIQLFSFPAARAGEKGHDNSPF